MRRWERSAALGLLVVASACGSGSAASHVATTTDVFPGRSAAQPRYQLGPPAVTGSIRSASARFLGVADDWVVLFSFNDVASARFNGLAAELFPKQSPQNSVAIVLDGVVQTAPAFQTSSFTGAVQISGNFTRAEAEALAAALRTGAYPVAVHLVS